MWTMIRTLAWLLGCTTGVGETPVAVPFTQVRLTGGLWAQRLETHRQRTLPYVMEQCERTGRVRNFAVAAGIEEGDFRGIYFDDSDVYKALEGAAYTLAEGDDPALRKRVDRWVELIRAAQEEDGYLYTFRTIRGTQHDVAAVGPERWSHLASSHELYNAGHLYEAAVAHFAATGDSTLLEVAEKNADLLCKLFGPGADQLHDPPGHEEIELGLFKLADVTGRERYLDLARYFLQTRGRHAGLYGFYSQDHQPVEEQREAVGHAVRAGYLYAAMAEAARRGAPYGEALDGLWNDVVGRKLYLTGGVGASRSGEAFGAAYQLPNQSAYAETCAAVALMLWSQRMFLLHGEGRYIDVLEWVLHNGFLAGLSWDGVRFFYPNPLACDGHSAFNQGTLGRSPWFSCSCCPVNIARILPSLPALAYATEGDVLYTNLYLDAEAHFELDGTPLGLRSRTRYPFDGRVDFTLQLDAPREFEVRLRIPTWTQDAPLPGGLYRYASGEVGGGWTIRLGAEEFRPEVRNGYARVRREWHDGETLTLELPMPVRRVVADERVEADRGRVALTRGPLVYAFEASSCGGSVTDLSLPPGSAMSLEPSERFASLQVPLIAVEARGVHGVRGEEPEVRPRVVRALPYALWANGKVGEMAVWLPAQVSEVELPPPLPFAARAHASASHCHRGDSLNALADGRLPRSSSDEELPRFTWWPRCGGSEWVQYDFDEPTEVSAVEVYWFDDREAGGCRVPLRARLLAKGGDAKEADDWRPIPSAQPGCERDRFNRVTFEPRRVRALRLEVELEEGRSGGILEWRVEGH